MGGSLFWKNPSTDRAGCGRELIVSNDRRAAHAHGVLSFNQEGRPMSVTESFERFLALEEQSLERIETLLASIREDIAWLEALDADEQALEVTCNEV